MHNLSESQRGILSLINCQLTQADVARKLKVSRSYVSQTISRLEKLNLVKRIEKEQQGKRRNYNSFYQLSPELQGKVKNEIEEIFTPVRVHHVLRKFHIVNQSGQVSKDKRSHYQKSWAMRGGERHKYWFPGKAGLPSVTIDVHPKTIVCYLDKGQTIAARNMEEAEQTAWYALFQAKDLFIEKQRMFGITFEIENVGQQIGNIHYGFLMKQNDPMFKEVIENGGKVGYADYYGDKSPEEKLGPGIGEIETEKREHATRLARAIPIAEAMPEWFRELEKLGPLTSEVHTVLAHIQSGQTVDGRLNQLILMFGDVLKQQREILDKLIPGSVQVR